MLRIRSRRARSSRSTLIVGQHVRRHISSVAETSQRNAAVAADLDPSDRTVVQTDAQPRVRWKLKRAQNGVPNDVTVTDDDFVLWRRRLRRRRRRRRRSVERLAKSSLDSRSVRDVHVLSLPPSVRFWTHGRALANQFARFTRRVRKRLCCYDIRRLLRPHHRTVRHLHRRRGRNEFLQSSRREARLFTTQIREFALAVRRGVGFGRLLRRLAVSHEPIHFRRRRGRRDGVTWSWITTARTPVPVPVPGRARARVHDDFSFRQPRGFRSRDRRLGARARRDGDALDA